MDETILIKFIIHTLITSTSVVCIEMFSLENIHVNVITWYTQAPARQLLLSAPPLRLCIIDEGWNFNSGNYLFTTNTK